MHYLATLRLFFPGGIVNDYRLRGNSVEFQVNGGRWRALSKSDLELHFRFNTEVARWLRDHSIEANPYVFPVR